MNENVDDKLKEFKEETSNRIDLIKQEIDDLQVTVIGQKKIWYKDVSTLIALMALFFSFGTTAVSLKRAEAQDIQSARQELRGLLQRLAALPKENLEGAVRFKDDATAYGVLSSLLNEENALLSRQAGEIAKKLPKGSVSATEYYAIANAMQNSYNIAGAQEFLKLSLDNAKDFNDEIGALRVAANLDFLQGHASEGRVLYKRALNVFSTYTGFDPYTINSTHLQTEDSWAISEMSYGDRQLVEQHLQAAEKYAAQLTPGPNTEVFKSQIQQVRQRYQGVSAGIPSVEGTQFAALPQKP